MHFDERAVVVGASMGGHLAARVLTDCFHSVSSTASRSVRGDVADHEQPCCRHRPIAKSVDTVDVCRGTGNVLWLTSGRFPAESS